MTLTPERKAEIAKLAEEYARHLPSHCSFETRAITKTNFITGAKHYAEKLEEQNKWIRSQAQLMELALKERDELKAQLREALEKLRDGPGNSMVGWKLTWAHKFAQKALEKEVKP